MKADHLTEPELEFGAGRHIDIRFGLMNYGPLDVGTALAPSQVRVGIVGTPDTVELARHWLERCREPIAARESRQPNLFPRFPGFRPDTAFQSTVVVDDTLVRTIRSREFEDLKRLANANQMVRTGVTLVLDEFEYLAEHARVDVLLCAVPPQLAELMDPAKRPAVALGEPLLDFHHMLKARTMHLKPVQLMLPSTADPSRARTLKFRAGQRRVQDDATRAWNFHTALYYKAMGRPWRLPRDPAELKTCYVGVSFYQTLDRSAVLTSMAQVFDERGDGVVVRGGPVALSKDDRTPHLTAEDAAALLQEALKRYRETHETFPARVVVHKTSGFSRDELDGFRTGAEAERISRADFVWVDTDASQRLFRTAAYPPLRGTLVSFDEAEHLLYTRGSVEFFATYPGRYIPRPLVLRAADVEATPRTLAAEVLALTKMNWNDTQFDGGAPITVVAARKVGSILKYLSPDDRVAPRYSYYM